MHDGVPVMMAKLPCGSGRRPPGCCAIQAATCSSHCRSIVSIRCHEAKCHSRAALSRQTSAAAVWQRIVDTRHIPAFLNESCPDQTQGYPMHLSGHSSIDGSAKRSAPAELQRGLWALTSHAGPAVRVAWTPWRSAARHHRLSSRCKVGGHAEESNAVQMQTGVQL